ncbi:MAG: hypothetical protein LBF72_02325 [Holosporales bacterium]|nr:hypothetical protein [Holosporales bacterium]
MGDGAQTQQPSDDESDRSSASTPRHEPTRRTITQNGKASARSKWAYLWYSAMVVGVAAICYLWGRHDGKCVPQVVSVSENEYAFRDEIDRLKREGEGLKLQLNGSRERLDTAIENKVKMTLEIDSLRIQLKEKPVCSLDNCIAIKRLREALGIGEDVPVLKIPGFVENLIKLWRDRFMKSEEAVKSLERGNIHNKAQIEKAAFAAETISRFKSENYELKDKLERSQKDVNYYKERHNDCERTIALFKR